MNPSIYQLSVADLLWASVPVLAVLAIFYSWSIEIGQTLQGLARMVVQLVFVGYLLTYIFAATNPYLISAILCLMLSAAGWISLRPLQRRNKNAYWLSLTSISGGSLFTLLIVVKGVLCLSPWYEPRYLIPIAGMILANAMNAVSLAAERFQSEIDRKPDYQEARNKAMHTAMIPITNSLFAVGLVSLPGMMTGQILSGTSPLIAVRYQIMVMCMVFGSAGISAGLYLFLLRDKVRT